MDKEFFEIEAVSDVLEMGVDGFPSQATISLSLASIAVSMKRIADRMEQRDERVGLQ